MSTRRNRAVESVRPIPSRRRGNPMYYRAVVILVVGALTATTAVAADPVPVAVKWSSARYPLAVAVTVGDKVINLKLTGVGLRSKAGLSVYAVGSYLQDGATAQTPEELTKADAIRMLHLVMERTVESRDFIDAFKTAVGKTYPADTFTTEFAQLAKAVGDTAAKKGDQVIMLYTPGTGVRIQIVGKVDVTIKGASFAQALWEVYLGPKPIDENLKKGLVGLLTR